LLMGTPRRASALVLLAAALAGCAIPGSGTAKAPAASSSRAATPSAISSVNPSPPRVTGAFGVLVSPLKSTNYTVSLVGIDGRVIGSAQAASPGAPTCGDTSAAVVPPPISTSDTRVYYMDAQGVVRYLAPNGDAGRASTVPIGPARRSMFAVSPDDQRIAVIVDDFTANSAATRLYVEDLNGGGHHLDLFSQSGAFTLWPTGWHGTNSLVVAKVPSCTQGGGPFCCGPQEFHVVDPGTAIRRFTVGGQDCVIAGPPSPAGAVCFTAGTASTQALIKVLNWTGGIIRSIPSADQTGAYISPDGHIVALLSGNTSFDGLGKPEFQLPPMCGWIDDTHVLSGGDTQQQPRIGDVMSGNVVQIPAQGDCGGRIPGGL
jgi:hypothetical protein